MTSDHLFMANNHFWLNVILSKLTAPRAQSCLIYSQFNLIFLKMSEKNESET